MALAKLFSVSDLDWGNWAYGLISAFIGGGSSAVVSGFVVAINDPKDYNLYQGRFYLLVFSVFAASGTLNFFAYLKQNPLPLVKTVETVKTTEIQPGTPLKKVETTTEKTTLEPKP